MPVLGKIKKSSTAAASMTEPMGTQQRKAEHIRICLEDNVQFRTGNGLEKYRFSHCCLPELDYDQIDTSTKFLGKTLGAPILISSMTGGTDQARTINRRLAEAAQTYGLAMGVGSQRVAIEALARASANEQDWTQDSFRVRDLAPDILLFANLGAVQLNYGYGLEQCQRAVDLLAADALILHINPLQECIQPRGDRNFSGLFQKIEQVCKNLTVPVIAKEVGNGISAPLAQRLIDVGVRAIDVAGAGGTSWSLVESARADNDLQRQLGRTFADWGLPTAECLVQIRQSQPAIPLIASGGLRNGLDAAKAIGLGADLAGLALPFLTAADHSSAAVTALVELLLAELKTALFCTGSANLADLRRSGLLQLHH
jgi:isopentenyl-diphosphate Delta-isomerase